MTMTYSDFMYGDGSLKARASSTSPAASTALPTEILLAIFHGLSPVGLASVARVCQPWRAVAEWLLYTHVSVVETLTAASPFPYRTLRCCQTLLAHPALAGAVRRLHVRWTFEHAGHPGEHAAHGPPPLSVALAALSDTLGSGAAPGTSNTGSVMAALEALDLHLGLPHLSDHSTPFPSPAFLFPPHSTHPHLRQLSLSGLGHPAHAAYLPAFLARVPSVVHLRLSDSRDPLPLPAGALPLLASFCGAPRAAASVLPGRPVSALALVGQDYVTECDLASMARAGARLASLDLSAMSVTPILLRNVSRALGHGVETLRVRLALRHTLHFALSGIRLLTALSHLLGTFDRLTTLDLSPTHIDYVGLSNNAEEHALCEVWRAACPSLRCIVFPSQTQWKYCEPDQGTLVRTSYGGQGTGGWMPFFAEGARRRPTFYPSRKPLHGVDPAL
ncbi:hypothetical protein CONPUDRAFT_126834 [Coniophora puteana RWD-64-598 SS2]|uniref:F-box domain-containing protein n=1 Tax=Coniophora puteana (strain RWD-64-598) TaxID=741705 RepID=A0A5M3MJ30_CONPW|nr:uncharacterized protein CONPUDRAFT_126834 [Coniophora puteana RWD-64-598 SS2]EIW79046.1 hypothetical protein CONPUDRAFT_126834 [Coniophora puteana RWD-64-598 SS2]